MQTDPTGYDDDINWYLYCDNNPITLVDPTGSESIVFSSGILCGPFLSNKKPGKWQGYIPVAGPMANAIYESKQGHLGAALWYNTMAMADWSSVTATSRLISEAGEVGLGTAGKRLLYGELGGNKTTRLYNKLGLGGLDEVAKYDAMLAEKGGGAWGALKTFTPEITSAYGKTIPKGLTLASSIGLSAGMRGLEHEYNYINNRISSSSASHSYGSGGK
jgi:hypothetical protein